MADYLEQPVRKLEALLGLSNRRAFLRTTALGGVLLVIPNVLAACSSADRLTGTVGGDGVTLDLTTDIGVLNFAYALEQLEAAFYIKVLAPPPSDLKVGELLILNDICQHEVVHREFLKAALGTSAIGALTVNFSKVDFTTRQGVLSAAKAFEDTGTGAYNGAGQLLHNPVYLTLAGKIVSVEARHASAIRDLLEPKTTAFAGDDVVDPKTGLDQALTPSQVLAIAGPFITTPIHV